MKEGPESVTFGIILCIVGSLLSGAGLILQKHSHNMGETELHLWCRWRWWLGFLLLVIVAGVTDALAMMLVPLSIIAPLSGLTLVINSILAMYFLNESLSTTEKWCIAAIMCGTSLTSAFGSHESPNYSSEQLLDLFQEWYMPPYFVLCTLIVGISIIATVLETTPPRVEAFAYANIAGCLGGALQNLFFKCAMELVKESVRDGGTNQWDMSVVPYVMTVLTVVLATAQLYFLNVGLARHAAIFYLPMYQTMLILYGIISGGIYFQEFAGMSTVACVMFPLGAIIVVSGLFALITKGMAEQEQAKRRAKVAQEALESEEASGVHSQAQSVSGEGAPLIQNETGDDRSNRGFTARGDEEVARSAIGCPCFPTADGHNTWPRDKKGIERQNQAELNL